MEHTLIVFRAETKEALMAIGLLVAKVVGLFFLFWLMRQSMRYAWPVSKLRRSTFPMLEQPPHSETVDKYVASSFLTVMTATAMFFYTHYLFGPSYAEALAMVLVCVFILVVGRQVGFEWLALTTITMIRNKSAEDNRQTTLECKNRSVAERKSHEATSMYESAEKTLQRTRQRYLNLTKKTRQDLQRLYARIERLRGRNHKLKQRLEQRDNTIGQLQELLKVYQLLQVRRTNRDTLSDLRAHFMERSGSMARGQERDVVGGFEARCEDQAAGERGEAAPRGAGEADAGEGRADGSLSTPGATPCDLYVQAQEDASGISNPPADSTSSGHVV